MEIDDPKIIAAIISGVISLVVSIFSGLYIVLQSRRKFDDLRKELLIRSSTEEFVDDRKEHLVQFLAYDEKIKEVNREDGSKAADYALDFCAKQARPFLAKHRRILGSKELEDLISKIEEKSQSPSLHNPESSAERRALAEDIITFNFTLYNRILSV